MGCSCCKKKKNANQLKDNILTSKIKRFYDILSSKSLYSIFTL